MSPFTDDVLGSHDTAVAETPPPAGESRRTCETASVPSPPAVAADLIVEVLGSRNGGSEDRPFRAIHAAALGVESLCDAVAPALRVSVRAAALLEDVDRNTVTGWFRLLVGSKDGGPAPLNSRAYLTEAIGEVAAWLSKLGSAGEVISLAGSLGDVACHAGAAKGTDRLDPVRVARGAADLHSSLEVLAPGDKLTLVVGDRTFTFGSEAPLDRDRIESAAAAFDIRNEAVEMLLSVTQPEYARGLSWLFTNNGRSIRGSIEDGPWLEAFERRLVHVRPGDLMRVKARTRSLYSADGTLIGERMQVTSVMELIEAGAASGR